MAAGGVRDHLVDHFRGIGAPFGQWTAESRSEVVESNRRIDRVPFEFIEVSGRMVERSLQRIDVGHLQMSFRGAGLAIEAQTDGP
jgi:hypothetical protein